MNSTLIFGNGDIFPLIGLGTWRAGSNEVYHAVIHALLTGYRHIDCAFVYGNENEVGRALKFAFDNGIVDRKELFITSKLWNHSHHPDDIKPAITESLSALGLDYLDLYLIHWPIIQKKDKLFPEMAGDMLDLKSIPLEETWKGMIKLKDAGLARHIGVSNFSIPKMRLLYQATGMYPEVNQVEMHPYFQQWEMIDFCRKHHILQTAYCPLGSSKLMGTENSLLEDPVISKIADRHQASKAQIILAWNMQRGVMVIPKSIKPYRIEENLGAVQLLLTDNEMEEIRSIDRELRTSMALYSVYENGPYTVANIFDI